MAKQAKGTYEVDYKSRRQTIFRTIKNQDHPFVMIDRTPIENPNLSWKAKGVLAYLISRPDNWIVQIGDLVKRSTDGVHAIRGAIKELEAAGHVHRKAVRDPVTKQFLRYELEVYELPFTSKPLTNYPQAGNLQAENLPLNDTDINENESNKGADAPSISSMPIDWQLAAGVETVILPDEQMAKRKDAAQLISMGFGINTQAAYDLALTFQIERNVTFTESDVKGQRKAIKALLEKNVTPVHVTQAVQKLMSAKMTFVDLFGVIKTAVDIASQPAPEAIRLL
jgi:hypothetical protein